MHLDTITYIGNQHSMKHFMKIIPQLFEEETGNATKYLGNTLGTKIIIKKELTI